MAKLHFVTGKGGVGKSTVAAGLVSYYSQKKEGPILLIDVQGSGHSLKLLGLQHPTFQNLALSEARESWGCRILPKETFKQYFGLLLALGNDHSTFASVTSVLREKLVDLVCDNKIVSAFVDVCPGLEPAVLLGKIHWEATEGTSPEEGIPWRHVIVDAPATGHMVMLLKSTFALLDVFSTGVILKQATKIKDFILDTEKTSVQIVSSPEEVPLQESLEMRENLRNLGLKPNNFILNRCPPLSREHAEQPPNLNEVSPRVSPSLELCYENWREQYGIIEAFEKKVPGTTLLKIQETVLDHFKDFAAIFRAEAEGKL